MGTQDFPSLKDRVVLITGGSGHIGSTLAEAFLDRGALVATTDINEDPAIVVSDREEDGLADRYAHFVVDLLDNSAVAELPAKVLGAFGRLDVVVCCAGFIGSSASEGWAVPFADQSENMWEKVLQVNLTSNFTLIKAAADALAQDGLGSVILVGSIYGALGPQPALYDGLEIDNPAGYAVSKAALTQLANWLSTVMAPHVRVNAVTPGGVFRD